MVPPWCGAGSRCCPRRFQCTFTRTTRPAHADSPRHWPGGHPRHVYPQNKIVLALHRFTPPLCISNRFRMIRPVFRSATGTLRVRLATPPPTEEEAWRPASSSLSSRIIGTEGKALYLSEIGGHNDNMPGKVSLPRSRRIHSTFSGGEDEKIHRFDSHVDRGARRVSLGGGNGEDPRQFVSARGGIQPGTGCDPAHPGVPVHERWFLGVHFHRRVAGSPGDPPAFGDDPRRPASRGWNGYGDRRRPAELPLPASLERPCRTLAETVADPSHGRRRTGSRRRDPRVPGEHSDERRTYRQVGHPLEPRYDLCAAGQGTGRRPRGHLRLPLRGERGVPRVGEFQLPYRGGRGDHRGRHGNRDDGKGVVLFPEPGSPLRVEP